MEMLRTRPTYPDGDRAQLNGLNEKITNLVRSRYGVELNAFARRDEILARLNSDEIARVQKLLEMAEASVLDMDSDASDLTASGSAPVWNEKWGVDRVLKVAGLWYPSDISDLIQSGDSIEIYDLENFQIYRNLTFMKKSGYSVLDVILGHWHELWVRPKVIQEKMVAAVMAAFQNPDAIVRSEIEPHFVRESYDSATARILRVDFRFLLPLKNLAGQMGGFLVASRAEVVDRSEAAADFHMI